MASDEENKVEESDNEEYQVNLGGGLNADSHDNSHENSEDNDKNSSEPYGKEYGSSLCG